MAPTSKWYGPMCYVYEPLLLLSSLWALLSSLCALCCIMSMTHCLHYYHHHDRYYQNYDLYVCDMGRSCLSSWFKLQFCSSQARWLQLYHLFAFQLRAKVYYVVVKFVLKLRARIWNNAFLIDFLKREFDKCFRAWWSNIQIHIDQSAYHFLCIAHSPITPWNIFVKGDIEKQATNTSEYEFAYDFTCIDQGA